MSIRGPAHVALCVAAAHRERIGDLALCHAKRRAPGLCRGWLCSKAWRADQLPTEPDNAVCKALGSVLHEQQCRASYLESLGLLRRM